MKKLIAILMLVSVLAIALTACSADNDVYQSDNTEDDESSSLDSMVEEDIASDSLGEEDFIEIGDMI